MEGEEAAAEIEQELTSLGETLTIRQRPSQGLSFQLWPAATSLVSLLDRDPDRVLTSLGRGRSPRLRILELGSGTGLVGIAAAALLGGDVVLTDMGHVLDNLRFNVEVNAGAVAARGGAAVVRRLEWGREEDLAVEEEVDLVLASDVVYHEHLFDPLLTTLRRLVVGRAVLVMAHLRRWKKDAVFFRKARKAFHVSVLHADPPPPGARLGVVVYRFAPRDG
ncbi:uncharacterized protein LOC144702315 [Wolffia australiana]